MNNAQLKVIRFILVFASCGILITPSWAQTRFLYHQAGDKINIKKSILQKASVNGKYEELIGTLRIPRDKKDIGSFKDDGYWHGGTYTYKGMPNMPPGYWVYVAPTWYVWKQLKSDQNITAPLLLTVMDQASISCKEETSNTPSVEPDLSKSDLDQITLEKAVYLSKLYEVGQYSYHAKFMGYEGYAAPIIHTGDGGALIFGNSNGDSDKNAYLFKVDRYGKQEWTRTFEPKHSALEAQSVLEDTKGQIFVFLLSYNYAVYQGGTERIVCLDKNGNTNWEKIAGKYSKEENPHFSYLRLVDEDRIYVQGHCVPDKEGSGKNSYHYMECWIEKDGEISLKIGPAIEDWKPWLEKFQPEGYTGSKLTITASIASKPTWQMTEDEKLTYMKKIANKFNIIDPVISYSFQGPAPPPGGYFMVSGYVVNRKGVKEAVLWLGKIYFTDRGESPSIFTSK